MERKETAPAVSVANLENWSGCLLGEVAEIKAAFDGRRRAEAELAAAEAELEKILHRFDELAENLKGGAAGTALANYAAEAGRVNAENQRAAGEYERDEAANMAAPAPSAELPDEKIVQRFARDAVPVLRELCRVQELLLTVAKCRAKIDSAKRPAAPADNLGYLVKSLTPLLDINGTWARLATFVRTNNAEWDAYMAKTENEFAARRATRNIGK